MNELTIIDADGHARDIEEDYEQRIEEPFSARMRPYFPQENYDRIGDDKIIFTTDYPHWDMTYPDCVSPIRDCKNLSDSAKRGILAGNAKRFYRLT